MLQCNFGSRFEVCAESVWGGGGTGGRGGGGGGKGPGGGLRAVEEHILAPSGFNDRFSERRGISTVLIFKSTFKTRHMPHSLFLHNMCTLDKSLRAMPSVVG